MKHKFTWSFQTIKRKHKIVLSLWFWKIIFLPLLFRELTPLPLSILLRNLLGRWMFLIFFMRGGGDEWFCRCCYNYEISRFIFDSISVIDLCFYVFVDKMFITFIFILLSYHITFWEGYFSIRLLLVFILLYRKERGEVNNFVVAAVISKFQDIFLDPISIIDSCFYGFFDRMFIKFYFIFLFYHIAFWEGYSSIRLLLVFILLY